LNKKNVVIVQSSTLVVSGLLQYLNDYETHIILVNNHLGTVDPDTPNLFSTLDLDFIITTILEVNPSLVILGDRFQGLTLADFSGEDVYNQLVLNNFQGKFLGTPHGQGSNLFEQFPNSTCINDHHSVGLKFQSKVSEMLAF
jgi:hypothetical protein